MYGMVNRALGDMIQSRYGAEAWDEVKKQSGIPIEVFIRNSAYPDEVTYKLVAAATEKLNVSSEDLLHEFGLYWVLNTAQSGYGELMRSGGKTLSEFLLNLPVFHTRVGLIFSELRPPRFKCTDVSESALTLHYYSERPGLAPFVVGLLHGLGEMFQTPVRVDRAGTAGNGSDHDIFRVAWEKPA